MMSSAELTPEGIATAANAIASSWPQGTPQQRRVHMQHLVDLIVEKFYDLPNNSAGGNLHSVLDDSNLSDESIQWCIDNTLAHYPDDVAAIAVGRMLLALTFAERVECAFVCPCCVDKLRDEAVARG